MIILLVLPILLDLPILNGFNPVHLIFRFNYLISVHILPPLHIKLGLPVLLLLLLY